MQNAHAARQPASPSLFQGAPAAKLMAIASVVSFFVIRLSPKLYNDLQMDTARLWQEPRRYMTSKLLFDPNLPGEFLMATLLLLNSARNWERQMGSLRFVAFVIMISAWSIAIEFALYHVTYLRNDMAANYFKTSSSARGASWNYNGPYALLGAMFLLFHWYTPRLHPRFVQAFGLTFSEKTLTYCWFAVVAAAHKGHSLAAFAVGMLACALYTQLPFLSVERIVPPALVQFVSSWSNRFLEEPPALIAAAVVPPPPGRGRNVVAQQAAAAAAAPRVPPQPAVADPAAVAQLIGMGFDQAQVEQALQQTNNNVERAADRLLSAMQ